MRVGQGRNAQSACLREDGTVVMQVTSNVWEGCKSPPLALGIKKKVKAIAGLLPMAWLLLLTERLQLTFRWTVPLFSAQVPQQQSSSYYTLYSYCTNNINENLIMPTMVKHLKCVLYVYTSVTSPVHNLPDRSMWDIQPHFLYCERYVR